MSLMSNTKILRVFVIIIIFCLAIGGVILININKNNNYEVEKNYNNWKKTYVVNVKDNTSRVINPQDNNITVSEGIGYGLLFSAAMKDKNTFDRLYNYMRLYLDKNGLMHWEIDSNGNVIGKGSATDADEDIAYAFLLAYKTWGESSYLSEGKKLVGLIGKYEISSEYMVLPGDSWGNNYSLNPSYIAPLYYYKFADVSDKSFWSNVENKNIKFLSTTMNLKTGFLPDWVNYDGSIQDKNNIFGYDAVRVPIRLLQFYNATKNSTALNILQTQYNFISSIGADNLVAGYYLSGNPMVTYINSTYLSSFSAISCINNKSSFSKTIIQKLIKNQPNDYYGSSLKLWVTLVLNGKL
jgi:endo-1,4-beta-D-glucanase Y